MAAGRRSAAIPTAASSRRNALRAVPARVRAVRQTLHAAFQEPLDPLVPRLAADAVRAAQTHHVPAAPASQSSMNLLRSSTGPVSAQGILEVLPISLDKCVTHQPGSYSIVGRQADTICLWTGAGAYASTGI